MPASIADSVWASRTAPLWDSRVQQDAGGVAGLHGFGEGSEDGAGVQSLLETEGDGAGDVVAGDHGALHGGGAAPGRQQREVQVHPAVAGHVEGGTGNQPAVGNDRRDVRALRRQSAP